MKATKINGWQNMLLVLIFTCFSWAVAVASPPLPPPGHDNPFDQQEPGSLAGGIVVLMCLGAAYGAKRVYQYRKELIN